MKLISIFVLLFSSLTFAQSITQPNHECSFQVAVPNLSCINPDGGEDVRLYLTEFQTCENGKITELDRAITGFYSSHKNIETMNENSIKIEFDKTRTHFDDREGDVTMILPTQALLQTEKYDFKLNISRTIQANYNGADIHTDWNYAGSFTKLDKQGHVKKTGRLICLINN